MVPPPPKRDSGPHPEAGPVGLDSRPRRLCEDQPIVREAQIKLSTIIDSVLRWMMTLGGLVHAEKVYKLKLAETWGPNFPIFGDASKNMTKMAEEMSNVAKYDEMLEMANKHF